MIFKKLKLQTWFHQWKHLKISKKLKKGLKFADNVNYLSKINFWHFMCS
jgi:hypothetical protein